MPTMYKAQKHNNEKNVQLEFDQPKQLQVSLDGLLHHLRAKALTSISSVA